MRWLVVLTTVVASLVLDPVTGRRISNRQDVIDDWIRTIRQSPKHHSMSPSWSGKSPYEVIGVSNLPLQTEEDGVDRQGRRPERFQDTDLGGNQRFRDDFVPNRPLRPLNTGRRRPQQGPFRRSFRPEGEGEEGPRSPQFQGKRKRRPGAAKVAYQNGNPRFQGGSDGPQQRFRAERFPVQRQEEAEIRLRQPSLPPELPSHYPPIEEVKGDTYVNVPSDSALIPLEGDLTVGPKEQEHHRPGKVFTSEPRRPPRGQPGGGIRPQFVDIGPNPFMDEEHEDFPRKFFEQPPRAGGPPTVPRVPGVLPREPIGPGPGARPKRKIIPSRPSPIIGGGPGGGPHQDLDINAGIPLQFDQLSNIRSQPLRDYEKPQFPSGDELQRGFKPYFKPSELFDDIDNVEVPHRDVNEPAFKDFTDVESPLSDAQMVELGNGPFNPNSLPPPGRPYRKKRPTPRPIPTPGPHDFPAPPPRRPRPPPTHPTIPPPITHPPEHYNIDTFDFSSTDSGFESETDFNYHQPELSGRREREPNLRNHRPFGTASHQPEIGNYRDASSSSVGHVNDRDDDDEEVGFFHIPDSFPSLESLGAGFESMKIRNKRSVMDTEEPLVSQERRFIPVRQRRQQHRRQGEFGFQPGFWEEVETEFFTPETPVFGQRNQPYTRRTYTRQSQQHQQRPTYSSSYESYRNSNSGRYRDPYPQQSVRESLPYGNDFSRNSYQFDDRDNEILGSGNFEVIKGGTFYDADTFYQTRYNARPQTNYNGNFLENFRDFADIKGDLYRHQYN